MDETDNFREHFKRLKKYTDSDSERVIDFTHVHHDFNAKIQPKELQSVPSTLLGLKPTSDWQAYTHNDAPGFTFIRDPFEAGYQRYWVKRCLHDYPCLPNVTNLDAHIKRDPPGNVYLSSLEQKRASPKEKTQLDKLRWATLGYHHNWDTKVYSADKHNPIPTDMNMLASLVARAIGYDSYNAEAAIVNYYHLNSNLGPHTDHSELDQLAPLISVSFGRPAIFMLGGRTKATTPIAMVINSGDIVVMSAEARLCYHAVPKIVAPPNAKSPHDDIPASLAPQASSCGVDVPLVCSACGVVAASSVNETCGDGSKRQKCDATHRPCQQCDACEVNRVIRDTLDNLAWDGYRDYISTARINMNIRQVFVPGSERKLDGDKT